MAKTKRDDYTSGYDQTDQDNAPAISFASVFKDADLPEGVTTPAQFDRGYLYTDTGLLIERDLTDSDWRGMLPEIKAIHSAYQFIVGDWAVYGVDHGFEDSYDAVAALTGFKQSTVEFYASICRSIPRLVRTNRLTFGHYQRIAPLPDDQRAYWITAAVDGGMSIRELREAIAKAQLPAETVDAGSIDWPDGVTVERVEWAETEDDSPALSDESIDIADVIHEKRISSFRKKAAQNRLADIDLNDIIAEQNYLANLRKKVAAAKVEADRQARGRRK